MMKILSLFLSAALVVSALPESHAQVEREITVEDLRRMYPDAELRQVDAAEFAAMTNDPGANAVVIVEPPKQGDAGIFTGQVDRAVSQPRKTVPPRSGRPARERRYRNSSSPDVYCADVYCVDAFGSFDAGSSEIAVIVFVVVGVVVVAAAFFYAGYFAYDMLRSDTDDYTGWWETGPRARVFYGGSRSGGMYGLRVGGGFSSDNADVGLMLEGGYIHGDVAIREDDSIVSVSSGYAMMGPTIRWMLDEGRNPLMLDMEVLAGMAADKDVDLISHASIGVSWGVGSAWRMGLSLGSLYMDIKRSEGPLRTESRFNLTGGLHFGRAL
jgi:hypothetical protein